MNDNIPSFQAIPEGSITPITENSVIVPIEDDLHQRLRTYVIHSEIDQPLLMTRLLNSALREFLDDHAPIQYPVSPLEA